jgi:hypothetical protein
MTMIGDTTPVEETPGSIDDFIDNLPDPGADEPAAPAAPAPAPEPAAESTATTPVVEDHTPAAPESFPRDYVEQLRNEAAERRVALKPFEDAFEGYTPEEKDTWLSLAKITAADPLQGAEYFEQIAKALRDQNAPVDPSTLTPEERAERAADERISAWEEQQKQEREEQARAAAAEQVNTEAKALGYTPLTVDYFDLLFYAQHETQGDLTKAHEKVQARNQKIIDDYVAAKAGAPPVSPVGATGTPVQEPPGTLEEARDAVDKWLDGMA